MIVYFSFTNKSFAVVNIAKIAFENDCWGGKLRFVASRLGSVGLGLGLVTSLGLRVGVSVSISSGSDKPGLPPQ